MTTNAPAEGDAPGQGRRPGRPRDAHRDEAILAAALEILNSEGYVGLTIEGVAARAGVGRPTIYRRWASKAELVVAALVDTVHIAVPDVDTGSLRRDLVAMQRRQVALMNSPESRRITAGLVADLATDPELGHTYVSEYLVPRRAIVFRVLQRAVDRGELARRRLLLRARSAGRPAVHASGRVGRAARGRHGRENRGRDPGRVPAGTEVVTASEHEKARPRLAQS